MAYVDKPDATDLKSQSQRDIKQNFTELNTIISVDHETFTSTNAGKHKQVTLTEQAAHPATGEEEIKLYCKKNAEGVESLFIQPADRALGDVGFDITTLTELVDAIETKMVILPSGVKLYWLKLEMSAATTEFILNMGTTFNTFSSLFFTPLNNSRVNYSVTKNTINNFTIHRSVYTLATVADILLMGL